MAWQVLCWYPPTFMVLSSHSLQHRIIQQASRLYLEFKARMKKHRGAWEMLKITFGQLL